MAKVLKIDPSDNVWVALETIKAGTEVICGEQKIDAVETIEIKHKMATEDLKEGDHIRMYGTIVGVATKPIFCGMKITTSNTRHQTASVRPVVKDYQWQRPDGWPDVQSGRPDH